jgi:hypothetical protein
VEPTAPPAPAAPSSPGVGWGPVLVVAALALTLGAATAVGAVVLVGRTPDGPPAAGALASQEEEADTHDDGYAVWARDADGDPVRWDPCRPIHLVVSGVGAPDAYPEAALLADVEDAAARLGEVTGLELVVEGTTDAVPDAARSTVDGDGQGDRRWAPVLIGWRSAGSGGLPLRDVDRAIAVPIAVGPSDARTYVTAQVALNPARDDLQPGMDDRATSWGATVLHELAHVLGLDHVDDPGELMHVYPGSGAVAFGPGDLAGLRAVGADGGCLAVPPPRELDVALPEP